MRLNNTLLPHQKTGVDKLINLKVGALFMEQGTGKTITTLELARIRFENGKIDKVIWLCPCSAKGNIKREILKQCPSELRSIFVICGIETLSSSIRANSYLINLATNNNCFLVIDESLLIKNPKAYRTENIIRLSAKCPYRIILNGTPISRNEADLYSQFYVLDWRILGYKSYWSFAANHLEYDEYERIRRTLNTDYLAEKISPYTYQVKKSECMSLPEKKYSTEYFSITSEQEELYYYVADQLLMRVNEFEPETIYRLFAGLQAVISGKNVKFNRSGSHFETEEFFSNPLDNPRISRVLSILPNEKTIIFCNYESEISQLCNLLDDSVRFDGSISMKKREDSLRKFMGEKKYLIANRGCAGFSLNLQFCHRIFYMSNNWDLGTRLQSEDRVHRMGQERQVEIIDICASDTIDEQILDNLYKKENLLDSIKKEIGGAEDKREALRSIVYGNKDSCSQKSKGDEYAEIIQL